MTSPPATPLDRAYALLQEGRPVEAEELMTQGLRTIVAAHGPGSPACAVAQSDLGHLLLNAHQPERAAECYRQAAAVPVPDDPEARKDHLTYLLNLGVALRVAGRLDEAEAELRDNARERLTFYGDRG